MVSDPLPVPQVTFVSVSTTQGTCHASRRDGELQHRDGERRRFGAVVTINTKAAMFSSSSLATNTATVTSTTSDPNPPNNFSTTISTIDAPTAVQLSSFRAQNLRRRRSRAGMEHARRISQSWFPCLSRRCDGRHRLNPSMIAGGALSLRGGQPQHAAKTYRWIDPQGTAMSSYSLEDVDMSGRRGWRTDR